MKTLTFISTLGIGLSLAACGVDPVVLGELVEAAERGDGASDEPPPENTDPPNDAGDTDHEDLDVPPDYPNAPSSYEEHEELVEGLLLRYCGDCHNGSPEASAAGVGVIGDLDALIALDLNLIIPGDREVSSVYTRMVDGDMPPVAIEAPRPSDEEIEYIGQFIDAMD